MTNERFDVGDIVRLKSGGPLMTVESIEGAQASCVWFVGDEKKGDYFELSSLVLGRSAQPPGIATSGFPGQGRNEVPSRTSKLASPGKRTPGR